MAQLRLVEGSQGALPPEHEAQLKSLICHNPTSYEPPVFWFTALAFPPDSYFMMHWQFAWFQEYLEHQVEIDWAFEVVPQTQLAQPPGQLLPQVELVVDREVEFPSEVLTVPAEASAKRAMRAKIA
jgi:hypothetical protein